jgi:group I intron endonuclease
MKKTFKPIGCIYKITNLENNKVYIGQTIEKNPLNRIKDHFSNGTLNDPKNKNHKFYNAVRKYGKEKFKIDIICECFSQDDLNQAEIYFIVDFYKSYNHYNIRLGGSKGKHSKSTKNKMRDKAILRYNISNKISKEVEKFIISNTNLGRVELTKLVNDKFNIKCSITFIQKFIQKHRKNNKSFKVKRDLNGKKIISEAQKKEISETLKNRNELNRIKALGVSKKQFLKLGKECKTLKEFKSNFSCKDSVINNCLLQWTGSFSFYKAFSKKLIAWNKKNK